MSSVFAPTDAIYSLFRTLTHQALEQHPDAPDSLAIGSYNYRPVDGGFVIRLYPSNANHPFEVGYLPKLAREKKGTIAQFVAANAQQPRLFEPSSPDSTREYLKTLLWACDHDREGLVDVKLPDDESEGETLALPNQASESSLEAASRSGEFSQDAPIVAVSFEALAEDILSGKPHPLHSGEKLADMYEVWGSRQDEVACVVVRHFDFGTALAVAALVPGTMKNQIDFDEAAYLLIQSLIDPAVQAPAAPVYKALRLLEGDEPRVRLLAALEVCRAETGYAYEPGLTGFPSAETLAYLKTFAHLPSAAADSEELEDIPDFERMARLRLLIKKTYEWSAEREASEEPRIELLNNRLFEGGLVLVQIEPKTDELYLSVFCPAAWDHALHAAFLEEVQELGVARRFDTSSPLPLPSASSFKHVAASAAELILRAFSDDAEAQDGCYHDFDPIDFAAPAPLAGERSLSAPSTSEEDFAAITRPRGVTLH